MLESAARLQQLVPDADLVGGSAAAMYAGHRESMDHGHVLTELVMALASPAPRDEKVTRELESYKGLSVRWHDWQEVVHICQSLAASLVVGP